MDAIVIGGNVTGGCFDMNRAEKILKESAIAKLPDGKYFVYAEEAERAMREIAWEAWKLAERVQHDSRTLFREDYVKERFNDWYDKQILPEAVSFTLSPEDLATGDEIEVTISVKPIKTK